MQGLMMDAPLLVSSVLEHAARVHGTTEIVARTAEGGIHRTTYARGAHARQAARQGAGAARRQAGRSGRLARLEHAPSFRAVLRRLRLAAPCCTPSTRACSRSSSSTSSITPRIPGSASTPRPSPIAEKLAPQTPGVKGWIYMSVDPEPPKSSLDAAELRAAAGRRGRRLRVAAVRREAGLGDLLHLGHDRPAQGRGQHAPLDHPERAGHEHRRHDRRLPLGHARGGDADRADVPRQRLADGLYRAAQRPRPGPARPQLRARQALRDHGRREGHHGGLRSDRVDDAGRPSRSQRPASCRRCGRPSSPAPSRRAR